MIKRLVVWFSETLLEAVLLGLALVGLFGYDQHAFVKSLGFYITGILLFSFTTGYLLTTVIARAAWRGKNAWSYSAIACLLYLLHSEIFFHITGGSTRSEQFSMQVAGVFIVLLCTFGGTLLLRRWIATNGESILAQS